MSDFRSAPPPPPMMHSGKIPNYRNNHGENFQTRCAAEPPACVQNAMLTKDKKPFTYTPGGLDLSQIKTPSMARRLNRQQRSLEEDEHPYLNGSCNGGGPPVQGQGNRGPPAPPPPPPVAPPPPPLVIQAPIAKSPKPVLGERPEIVIPENPIGMLRKTHSPYHWESELADRQREGPVPKYNEKSATPSPVQPQLRVPPPPQFTQQPPQYQQFSPEPVRQFTQQPSPQPQLSPYTQQTYTQQPQYSQQPPDYTQQQQYNNQQPQYTQQAPPSPARQFTPQPQAQARQFTPQSQNYTSSPQPQNYTPSPQPQKYTPSPKPQNYTPSPQPQHYPTNGFFQKSPQPTSSPSSFPNSTSESPVWKPEPKYPTPQTTNSTPSQFNDSSNTTPIRDLLQRQDSQFNKSPAPYSHSSPASSAPQSPWRQSQSSHSPALQEYRNSPYQEPQVQSKPFTNNLLNIIENTKSVKFSQPEEPPQYIYNNVPAVTAPWRNPQHQNAQPVQKPEEEVRFQSHMTIPVIPRKQNNPDQQREAVYVTQEPVYYRPADSPKEVPPWVRAKSEKEKTPPPEWVQRPLGERKSVPRDSDTAQPPWAQVADLRRSVPREPAQVSPPTTGNQPPPWSQKPSDNRKSVTRDTRERRDSLVRIIPIKMEVNSKEVRNASQQSNPNPNSAKITIELKSNNPPDHQPYVQYSQPRFVGPVEQQTYPQYDQQPQQRVTRVANPQMVRLDDSNSQQQNPQPKTRIIPIQIEPQSPGVNTPKRIYYHQFSQEGPPRQSRSFRVLQAITGTLETDDIQNIETEHGFSDL